MYMGNTFDNSQTYSHEKLNFMVGLSERLNLPEVFNKHLEQQMGDR